MQETRLLLIRHAETSAPDVFHGAESDIGLSAWGEHQAIQLGERLKDQGAHALYCSAMRRAVDTARPIGAACGLDAVHRTATPRAADRPALRLEPRNRVGNLCRVQERWIAGEIEFTHPGGESYADIRRRVVPVFEELRARHLGETLIVVAHGVVIRVVLLSLLEGLDPADFDRIAIDFASINDLRLEWHEVEGPRR